MAKRAAASNAQIEYVSMALSGATVFAALFLVVPILPALTTGIASTSLVLFGLSTIGLLGLIRFGHRTTRPLLLCALGVAMLGLLIPQLAYLRAASLTETSLTFNPISYLHFSGTTDLKPTKMISYKTVNAGTLEMAYYQPPQSGPRPVVVLLHGGAWRYGNHLETGTWTSLLTNAGYAVVSVQYRLANDTYHTWQDAPRDVHDAISYLKENAAQLSIQPGKISLLGQSAGGHLALLEAYTSPDVHSVISLYAPIDLASDYTTSKDKSAELDFIGGPPSQFAERYKQLSPFTYVSHSVPPTLLVQGKMDDLVHVDDTVRLSQALALSRVAHEIVLLPLTGHSFENQRGGFATQITEQRVLRFLSR